mmetsp:Transcript_12121/g.25622  ORF Transcript_12121/g.25622 Transcript_12121/m.25622 type:complete len:205 (-) Transcript_12121:96-710(-)
MLGMQWAKRSPRKSSAKCRISLWPCDWPPGNVKGLAPLPHRGAVADVGAAAAVLPRALPPRSNGEDAAAAQGRSQPCRVARWQNLQRCRRFRNQPRRHSGAHPSSPRRMVGGSPLPRQLEAPERQPRLWRAVHPCQRGCLPPAGVPPRAPPPCAAVAHGLPQRGVAEPRRCPRARARALAMPQRPCGLDLRCPQRRRISRPRGS